MHDMSGATAMTTIEDVLEAAGDYFDCGVNEGRERREVDTPDGIAQKTLGKLRAAIEQYAAERVAEATAEWNKLRDPVTLHVSLLRGFPAQLDRATFLHIAGDEPPNVRGNAPTRAERTDDEQH
jgi:hypothetical protein